MLPNSSVTAVAESTLLIQQATVKTELGITGSDDDSRIDRLIYVASDFIARWLGREPWFQTYSDKIPGDGGIYLWLPHWPIKGEPSSITFGTSSSPSTVDSTTYSVAGRARRKVYRANAWSISEVVERAPSAGSQPLDYTVAYDAGWVMPDQITAWAANTSVAANEWYKPTSIKDPLLLFQAGGAGTTHASTEPTWPTVEGGTVVDNDITWTAHRQRLPYPVEEAALMLVMDWFRGGLQRPSGIARRSFDGALIEYTKENVALSSAVARLLGPYR